MLIRTESGQPAFLINRSHLLTEDSTARWRHARLTTGSSNLTYFHWTGIINKLAVRIVPVMEEHEKQDAGKPDGEFNMEQFDIKAALQEMRPWWCFWWEW